MSTESTTNLRPLCVDLDGTLVKTDTFAQALLLLVRTRPAALLAIPGWASKGLAAFKQRIAQEIELDPAALPLHEELLAYLKSEHARGRTLILATASDQTPAQAIAHHIGLFSEVMASDGTVNLKADRKRDALVARFGERGFDYAGNASDDRLVWAAAHETIVINPCAPVRRALQGTPHRLFEDRPAKRTAWRKALRMQQWIKNSLLFLPMMLAHELSNPALYRQALLAFFSFSALASSIYILNDLMDLHADQHHPRKNRRPFAAGNLSLLAAVVAVPSLILAALLLALWLPPFFMGTLLVYLLMTTLYSWRVKQLAGVDVLVLAGFYTLRILAGTAAYGVETSPWLIAFSLLLFLSLALIKRYTELREAVQITPAKIEARGRGYHARHLPWLNGIGIFSGVLSTGVLALYISSEKVTQFYTTPASLWFLCPILLYWISRIWRLAGDGTLSDDPLEFAARDRQTWLLAILGIIILIWGSL